MNILDSNQKYILASGRQQTFLFQTATIKQIKKKSGSYKTGSLQYGTGIAVLCKGSVAIFYDFKYERTIESLDTYLKLLNICLIKNLLIAVSQQRILIYDTKKKQNLCNISTYDGRKVTINKDYYNLKIFYPVSQQIFNQKQIWNSKNNKIQCSKQQKLMCYDQTGQILCFVEGNVLSLYKNQEIIRGCSFQFPIKKVKSNGKKGGFFVQLQNDKNIAIKQQQIMNKDLQKYIYVSQSEKTYLQLIQYQDIQFNHFYKEMIVFNNSLYVCLGNKIYKTRQDINFKTYKNQQYSENQKKLSQNINDDEL